MRNLKVFIKKALPRQLLVHLQAWDHYHRGEPEIRLLSQLSSAGRDAIDAGANIGTYTYFLRKHARRVYAFEPNPNLATRLSRQFPKVVVRNLALSDKLGEVVLKMPIDAQGNELHELSSIVQNFQCSTRDFPIKSVTIDSQRFDNIGFLKVDVEQHEREVLRGAMETIRRCRPTILTEVSPLKYDDALPEVFSFLTRHAYVGWFRFAGTWLPLAGFKREIHSNRAHFGDKEKFVGGNIIFFPAEHALSQSGPQA
ncbi:FkbM family methyltransferase [Pseudoduganella sp. LjRoot289]|uniref:FkbM family methyltransferase n=1 Tax=Pseudoduganella sp. LjRoot289 TaxID=3342314 RepID=UPI003ECEBE88